MYVSKQGASWHPDFLIALPLNAWEVFVFSWEPQTWAMCDMTQSKTQLQEKTAMALLTIFLKGSRTFCAYIVILEQTVIVIPTTNSDIPGKNGVLQKWSS